MKTIRRVFIISILGMITLCAGIVLYRGSESYRRSMLISSMVHMRWVETPLAFYFERYGHYPRVGDVASIEKLIDAKMRQDIIKEFGRFDFSSKDAWNNSLVYVVSKDGMSYVLASHGKDGMLQSNLNSYLKDASKTEYIESLEDDIIINDICDRKWLLGFSARYCKEGGQ
jgi:hypothetical protein